MFHGPLTLLIFMSKFVFSASVIAASVKPCIVIVLDITFNIDLRGILVSQNVDCWYELEPPHQGGSMEYPQSLF